jgi:hypothetical protein
MSFVTTLLIDGGPIIRADGRSAVDPGSGSLFGPMRLNRLVKHGTPLR